MIRALTACALLAASSVALAATSTASSKAAAALDSSMPWWEKVTVTVSGDGQPQSCRFESSIDPSNPQTCDVAGNAAATKGSAQEQYTRITFERRFSPGAQPASGGLQIGDTLLGRQVMALAIDPRGAVKGCKVVAVSGAMTPDYGCEEASAERFQASAAKAGASGRSGTMTVLVYGHAEHVV